MRVALVHEFLNQLGGAERVLENFLEIWPDADVHTIFYNAKKTKGLFSSVKKKISMLNSMPLAQMHPRLFLPLMTSAIEGFDFREYDVVISDSSSFAKGVVTDKLHICYCHAPTRYIWTVPEYIEKQRYPQFLKSLGRMYLGRLKKWDYVAAQRPNFFIANSRNIQNQIKQFYKRDSVIIPPPVDTELFYPEGEKEDYFLAASRLEPYKKTGIVVKAFNNLGLNLKVAGTGTDMDRLKKLAKSNIDFLGLVTDEELRRLYSGAKAFVFAAEEDAGIMPLEANSCGTPVIVYKAGGVLETVIEGVTGEFFGEQTAESLIETVKIFDVSKYDAKKIREHALQYDKKIFQKRIKDFVEEKYHKLSQNKEG